MTVLYFILLLLKQLEIFNISSQLKYYLFIVALYDIQIAHLHIPELGPSW